ncbi:MAG TPA: prepilin-type N-terminal cleavage/methylation domain-containing protein [Candidatus Paceibacterota bacterium]|nr:prepilin-type N-terminal cleavage/methylation domain-containing protein [Candidatus Paceibacterota bacterium]
MDRKGFTLIEILIVLAITAVLSGLAIVYSHVGQSQISLSIEESKVAQLILEAKELSIATYSADDATCAYGVQFNLASSTYSLFAYNAAASSTLYPGRPICPSLASTTASFDTNAISEYAGGSWQIHTAQGVVLDDPQNPASDTIQDVLFYPPDPFTLISFDGQTFSGAYTDPPAPTGYVYLSTVDGSASRTISVNSAGQVSL